MKKNLLKVAVVVGAFSCTLPTKVFAQDDAANIVKTGIETANSLANAYTSPIMKSLGLGLVDGWNNNTARTLGPGGFDIRFNFGMSFIPSSDLSYDVNDVFKNTDKITWTNNLSENTAPSIFGSDKVPTGTMDGWGKVRLNNVPDIANGTPYTDTTVKVVSFHLPPGINVPYFISLPSAQFSVGIYKNTEMMIRFMPTVAASGFKVGTWGIGVKHDIKQWIPTINEQEMWDWSVFAAYSSFNSEFAFGDKGLKPDSGAYNPNPGTTFDNQKITMSGNGFTLGTIVSAKLLFFTPYLGINYSYSGLNLKFEGDYPVPVPNENHKPAPFGVTDEEKAETKISTLTNPINVDGSLSSLRLSLGARIKMGPVLFGGEYSIGKYNTATMSMAINLQSIVPFKL